MVILYEDSDIIICQKEPGEASELTEDGKGPGDEIRAKYGYAGIIHRLDKPVGGAIVYAKNKASAAYMSSLVCNNQLFKEYLAVVEGVPEPSEGEMRDYLFKDSHSNKVFTVKRLRRGVREAVLDYRLLQTVHNEGRTLSLVKIKLRTGRTHQIRVQFASRKMPLAGDGKYGSRINRCSVALWSHSLEFASHKDGEYLRISSEPPRESYPWMLFDKEPSEEYPKLG